MNLTKSGITEEVLRFTRRDRESMSNVGASFLGTQGIEFPSDGDPLAKLP